MSYQKCPKCNGYGSTGIGFPTGERCSVCGGAGIINEQTGKPPENNIRISGSANDDPRA